MMEENAKLKEQLNGVEEKLKSSMDLQKQLDALTQEKDAALSNTAKLKEALQLAEDARNEASSKLEESSQKKQTSQNKYETWRESLHKRRKLRVKLQQ